MVFFLNENWLNSFQYIINGKIRALKCCQNWTSYSVQIFSRLRTTINMETSQLKISNPFKLSNDSLHFTGEQSYQFQQTHNQIEPIFHTSLECQSFNRTLTHTATPLNGTSKLTFRDCVVTNVNHAAAKTSVATPPRTQGFFVALRGEAEGVTVECN